MYSIKLCDYVQYRCRHMSTLWWISILMIYNYDYVLSIIILYTICIPEFISRGTFIVVLWFIFSCILFTRVYWLQLQATVCGLDSCVWKCTGYCCVHRVSKIAKTSVDVCLTWRFVTFLLYCAEYGRDFSLTLTFPLPAIPECYVWSSVSCTYK